MGIDRKTKLKEKGLVAVVSLGTTLETSIFEITPEVTHYRVRNGNSSPMIELYSGRGRKRRQMPNNIVGMRIPALLDRFSYTNMLNRGPDLLNRGQLEEAKKTARILRPQYLYE